MSERKLVAFDLDGTLIGRDLQISPRVAEAIAKMRQAGHAGCIVTGRMFRATLPYVRELEFDDAPVVCYQGAAIIDPQADVVLAHNAVPNAVVRDIIALAEQGGAYLQLYRNDEYYAQARNRFSDMYSSLAGIEPVVVPSLAETFAYSDSTKAVIVADAPDAAKWQATMSERLGKRAYVTRSLPEFVEILSPDVDKGQSIRFVARTLGISMENVIAIGDSWNDAPMLRAAGFGIAMGSAPQELRDVADAVVADNAHDGVAEALEKYVLA